MPFNPALPANHAPVLAPELRNQFNALKSLIDDLPPGVTQEQLADAVNSLQANIDQAFVALEEDLDSGLGGLSVEIQNVRNGSANNVDAINIVDLIASNPPTQADVQAVIDKLNELINGLHR